MGSPRRLELEIVVPDLAAVGRPSAVVQRQVDAYNARDLEGFLACYSPDIHISTRGREDGYSGLTRLRERYQGLFERSPDLHATIVSRLELGEWVVDEETLVGHDGSDSFRAIAIYRVQESLIAEVSFLR